MSQTQSLFLEKNKKKPYFLVNFVFAFFPISFVLGSLIVNLNFLIFVCLGIYYLKGKILNIKSDLVFKIIFLFFLSIFISTFLDLINNLYFAKSEDPDFERFFKSILFLRFFLFLIIVYLLNKSDILKYKYFFFIAAISSLLISLDIIFQYIFGFNSIGLKSFKYNNSGFFGDEAIAGGYIQRFSFFAIFFTIFLFKNNNYSKFLFTVAVIIVLSAGILFSGNRMPFILFILGLLVFLFAGLKIKKIVLVALIGVFALFKFTMNSNETYRLIYSTLNKNLKNLTQMVIPLKSERIFKWGQTERNDSENEESIGQKTTFYYNVRWESNHRRLFLAAVDTWKFNKIFGNGIKSFRVDCYKLAEQGINLEENLYPDKKNRLCSAHPHNYYFEILTDTGIVGILIIFIIGLYAVTFAMKNLKLRKEITLENLIFLSAIVSLLLETFPFRSSGSLFTTNNATYLILVASIVLSYKKTKN